MRLLGHPGCGRGIAMSPPYDSTPTVYATCALLPAAGLGVRDWQLAIAGESEMGLPGDLAGARTVRARIILQSGRSRPGRRQREMRAQLVVGVGAYATTGGRSRAHPASRQTGRGRPFGSLLDRSITTRVDLQGSVSSLGKKKQMRTDAHLERMAGTRRRRCGCTSS